MCEADTTIIAGTKTCGDWRAFRGALVPGNNKDQWDTAFRDYYETRIELRYFKPIYKLQENDTMQGEGFSIVAIQCTLVEFLESTVQGKNYRFIPKGQKLGQFEYSKSKDIFIKFLSERQPFKTVFDETLAKDFYENVRCGLLHEARTKNGWLIRAKDNTGAIVRADSNQKILFRNNFQNALKEFITWYKGALTTDRKIQEAFIRKFNYLCDC